MSIAAFRSRLRAMELASTEYTFSELQATNRIAGTNPDGSYAGTNYLTDPRPHAEAIKILARAYWTPTHSRYLSPTVKSTLVLLLNYYETVTINSSNWYHRWIQSSTDLGVALILMDSETPDGFSRAQLAGWNNKVYDLDFSVTNVGGLIEGSNLMYLIFASIMKGILNNSSANFTRDLNALNGEIARKNSFMDGLVTDWSYRFHLLIPQWTNGYGFSQVQLPSKLLPLTVGTAWESLDKLDEYLDSIINGLLWHQHKRTTDIIHMGRGFGDPIDKLKLDEGGATLSHYMNNFNGIAYRSSDISFIKSIADGTGNMPAGIRYHYLSHSLTRKTNTSHIGIMFPTKRQFRASESFNNEGIPHMWLRFGSYMMITDPEELYRIQPSMIWSRIPGATTLDNMPTFENPLFPLSNFGGAAHNNEFGVVGYKHDWKQVTGNKFYFVTPIGIFCMGNNLASTNGTHQMITTLQQNISATVATVKRATESSLNNAETTQSDIVWVFNGKAGYFFPSGGNVTVTNQNQSGAWSAIEAAQSGSTVTQKIFSVRLNHGVNTSNQSYQYGVVQDTTLEAMQSFANPYTVIKNDGIAQVVKYGANVYAMVFYQKTLINLEASVTVAVKDPCVMLIVFPSGNRSTAMIYVTDPVGVIDNLVFDISLRLTHQYGISKGGSNTVFKIPMPKQDFACSCVELNCNPIV